MAKEIKHSEYTIKEGEKVYEGQHSSIEKVDVSIGKHKVPLLRKRFIGYSADFMSGPGNHSFLNKKGYPVFPTWRYDQKKRLIILQIYVVAEPIGL